MTLNEQLSAINTCTTLQDIQISYDALHQLMQKVSTTNDLSYRLVNYQTVAYLAQMLNKKALEIISTMYSTNIENIDADLQQHFTLYKRDYNIYHTVQLRQNGAFHVEFNFASKYAQKQTTPFVIVSIIVDCANVIHDVSVVINSQQAAASSLHNSDAYAAIVDRLNLQRFICMSFNEFMYESFLPIVINAMTNKVQLASNQTLVQQMYSKLIEDFSVDMHESLAFIAEAVENFAMYSILPRNDGMPGFDLTKYRVSCEKIHNINIDTSVASYDEDGEVEVPETFVRFESIRKRELQQYMLNKLAFITANELSARIDSDNMLHWLNS